MSHRTHSTSPGAAARDRGRARLRAATVSAVAASLIAAGGVAAEVPRARRVPDLMAEGAEPGRMARAGHR